MTKALPQQRLISFFKQIKIAPKFNEPLRSEYLKEARDKHEKRMPWEYCIFFFLIRDKLVNVLICEPVLLFVVVFFIIYYNFF